MLLGVVKGYYTIQWDPGERLLGYTIPWEQECQKVQQEKYSVESVLNTATHPFVHHMSLTENYVTSAHTFRYWK